MKFKTVKEFLEWLIIDPTMEWADDQQYIGVQFDTWSIRVCTSNVKLFTLDDEVDNLSFK